MDFTYFLPVHLKFGWGMAEHIGEETARFGNRALIVTGRNSTKASGLLERVRYQLQRSGCSCVVYDRAEQNPTTDMVTEAVQLGLRHNCNVVLGIGGGGSMDTAKATALMLVNRGHISEYLHGTRQIRKAAPLLLVPTTCGSGSEGNGVFDLTDVQSQDKKSLYNEAIVAKCSILDPALMQTMPKAQIASVGFDALCHCTESLISRKSQPLTQMIACSGLEKLLQYLPMVYSGEYKRNDWEQMCLASCLGGMAIHHTGCTAPHGLAYPVSGLKNVMHGQSLSALMPVILEKSIEKTPEKFDVLARVMGVRAVEDCLLSLEAMIKTLELPRHLSDLGVLESDIHWLTESCTRVSTQPLLHHPVQFERDEIRSMYLRAI